uniref:Putative ankyrin repeat protein n=1 Tax=Moumouvirus sp. 'Monve' TaxID=1128131 RepID=H2ECV9_9VIRU|nr:putative ankyrin repeat protein [Moumouvirus Monve]
MDHQDQDVYSILPTELWRDIIEQDIKQIFGLLFTSKQFFGLVSLLSNKFMFLHYLLKKDTKKFIEYFLQCDQVKHTLPPNFHKNRSKKNNNAHLNEYVKLSCTNGHLDVLDYCIKNGANYRINNDEPVRLALENGHFDIAEFLYKKKVNIRTGHNTAFVTACKKGDINTVKFLLEKKLVP